MPGIEVCFSPALLPFVITKRPCIIVVTDILRATSSICSALHNGAKSIIPVTSIDEARAYKSKGYMVAGERDGRKLDFADFGNSPLEFFRHEVKGIELVYTTTNGTVAIGLGSDATHLLLGAFANITALSHWLTGTETEILILCSGWMNMFSLEDSVFAGCLARRLLDSGKYATTCDSTLASMDLWDKAKDDLPAFLDKASHRRRLMELAAGESILWCFTPDQVTAVPGLVDGRIIDVSGSAST